MFHVLGGSAFAQTIRTATESYPHTTFHTAHLQRRCSPQNAMNENIAKHSRQRFD
jgi:hypothetical protein